VLEVVPGGLHRWVKSTGGWIGVVKWVGRTTAGESVKAADQWITAARCSPGREVAVCDQPVAFP
jgi:hypothetical protein